MLRHMGQHGGGVMVYTKNLLRELLALDSPHEFVLMYQDPRFLGTYGNGGRVREIAVRAPSVVLWDQMVVPYLARREKLDLIFNPKYSVPLAAPCPSVFVCHGLDWYVMPQWSRWMDRLNHRYLMPKFAAKAAKIIAVSNTARDHVLHYLPVSAERVETIYLGVVEGFHDPIPATRLEEVREAYDLPKRFFHYCGQIYPPKNFGRLLQAFATVGPPLGISLVVAGEHRWLCEDDLALVKALGISRWVVRPGWIAHEELPAFYRLAEALVMPSLYEACPSPPLEAMASGCPVVTANRHGTKEIAGDSAVLVDPEDIESIAGGMRRIVTDHDLRNRLTTAGHRRARQFTWQKCARETLGVLERTHPGW